MKISAQEVPAIVGEFVQSEIVPKASTKGTLATLGFLLGGQGLAVGVGAMLSQYLPILQSLAVVDKDGKIDLDDLKSRAENALKMAGGKMEILGGLYFFDAEDIDALLRIAENHAIP